MHIPDPAKPQRVSIVGDIATLLATAEQTNGAYTLMDMAVFPDAGPPPHIHGREDEAFFVIDGEVTFYAEDRKVVGGPGFFIHLPRGKAHRFHNHSNTTARMLVLIVPGGLERFFLEIGVVLQPGETQPAAVTPERIEKIMAVAPRYGLTILPPA